MKYLAKKNFTRVFSFQLFQLSEREASLPFFQMRGEWKEKQGDYQGALEDYEKAIFLDDSNPIFYVLKAGIYEKLKTSEMALENFDIALSINHNRECLSKLGLNERQVDAVLYVKEKGEITTSAYTKRYGIAERTARHDLNELVDKQIFKRTGETNLAKYVLL
jgi:tetratricopeptide (TPR) repeat protein